MGTSRQLENEKHKCPKCNGRTVKCGINHHKKKQKRRCCECNCAFQEDLPA